MNPKISIIIPIYNAGKYLRKCLESVVHQTFDDFEIVLVDDAGTDASMAIADEFVKKSGKTFHIVHHQQNKGLPSARKSGLEHAEGDYIFFLDADDWIESDTLEKFAGAVSERDRDIVVAGIDRVDDSGNRYWAMDCDNSLYLPLANKPSLTPDDRKQIFRKQFVSYWGHLYRREWFLQADVHFMEGASFDEDDVASLLILKADSIGYVNSVLYHYVFHKDTMSFGTSYTIHLQERENCTSYVLEEARRLHLYETYQEDLEYFRIQYLWYAALSAVIKCNYIDGEYLRQFFSSLQGKEGYRTNKYYLEDVREQKWNALLLQHSDSKEEFLASYYSLYGRQFQADKKYINSLQAEREITEAGCREMSKTTQALLDNVDYDSVRESRARNFNYLHAKLGGRNGWKIPAIKADGQRMFPMIYPLFLPDRGDDFRKRLVEKKIYVPQWWKYLLNEAETSDWERALTKHLFPLPIDQRYSLKDMDELADIVLNLMDEG